MSAKSFIFLLSIIFVTGLFILFAYNIAGSGTGGIIELYELDYTTEVTEIKLDSLIESNKNIKKISGEDYFESLNYEGEFKSDIKNDYERSKYIVISNNSKKIIFKYNFSRTKLALESAAEYGKLFNRARNIGFWDSNEYENIFEDEIINKLNSGNSKNY